jgi:hypothetical protein
MVLVNNKSSNCIRKTKIFLMVLHCLMTVLIVTRTCNQLKMSLMSLNFEFKSILSQK